MQPEIKTLYQGESLDWIRSYSDYPASDGYTLTYFVTVPDGDLSFTASDSGDSYSVDVASTDTDSWPVGTYLLIGQISKDDFNRTVYQGQIEIKAALNASNVDRTTHVQRTLEALEATIEKRATKAQKEYEIAGRQMQFYSIEELLMLKKEYTKLRSKELIDEAARNNGGKKPSGKILVKFK